ncbi:MAG TPA: hypothetical protein VKP13_12520 [Nitrospira sp.]|nr:hypothetical protein [Nitrospira sp.]
MTQELILGVLLAGLVGLIWVMTVSILAGAHPTSKEQNARTSSH